MEVTPFSHFFSCINQRFICVNDGFTGVKMIKKIQMSRLCLNRLFGKLCSEDGLLFEYIE